MALIQQQPTQLNPATFNFNQQNAEIEKRMLLAKMLQNVANQSQQNPSQTVGSGASERVVPLSPWTALLNGLSQGVASYQTSKAAHESGDLADQRQKYIIDALKQNPQGLNMEQAANAGLDANQLLDYQAKQQQLQNVGHGTEGANFIPAGAISFKDPETGFVGYKTKEGALIPSHFAMTEYQQNMLNPETRGAVAGAIEQGKYPYKIVKTTGPQGEDISGPAPNIFGMPKGQPTQIDGQTIPESDIVNKIAMVESSGNVNANHKLTDPNTTSTGLYGMNDAYRKDRGLVGATTQQETEFKQLEIPALASRYGGNENLAVLAHHIGVGAADKIFSGETTLTPEHINYLAKVTNAPIFKSGVSTGPTMQQKNQADVAKEAALTPVKNEQLKQAEEIKNESTINQEKLKQQQTDLTAANHLESTLKDSFKYTYPNEVPERNKEGKLMPPKEAMILGNSPIDRMEKSAHELGYTSQKATNLGQLKGNFNQSILDLMGGKLGTAISDADRNFFASTMIDMEKAQHIDDVYATMNKVEDRVKAMRNRYGSSNKESSTQQQQISDEDLLKKYGAQ